jgi:hypothetical protein
MCRRQSRVVAKLMRATFIVGALPVSVVACVCVGVPTPAVAATGDHGATAVYVFAEESFARAQASVERALG